MDNKRIDLVTLASFFRKVEDLSRPPMGLLYIGSVLRQRGYDVRIHHILSRDIESVCGKILERDPLFVGFSSFTGPVIKNTVTMMRKLKQGNPSIPVVWGGIHPTLVPRQCLQENAVDYVSIGEGEETVVEFSESIDDHDKLSKVKGIGFKSGGKMVINAERPFLKNLDFIELDWVLLEDINQYVKTVGGRRLFPLYTSRGCPHNCGFCYNLQFNKRQWRAHSVEYVMRMVATLREKIDFNAVSFDDDNFFTDWSRGIEIIKRLKEVGVDTDWLDLRVSYLTEERLDTLAELGIKCIFTGWESGNERILRLINKQITPQEILAKMQSIAKRRQFREVDTAAIIGFPTETWRETRKTLDLALRISKILPNVNPMIQTYLPFPGTDLFPLAVKEGFKMPQDPMGWEHFDIIDGQFEITWLKNYPFLNIRKRFYYISKYVFMLNRTKEKNFLLTAGKHFFHHLAYFRLRNQFFWFPWEIWVFEIISGWIIRRRRSNAFRLKQRLKNSRT